MILAVRSMTVKSGSCKHGFRISARKIIGHKLFLTKLFS